MTAGSNLETHDLCLCCVRLDELFATHEHALTRISSIYKYFQSFEASDVKSSAKDVHDLEKRYDAAVSSSSLLLAP